MERDPLLADGASAQGTAAFVRASGRERHLALLDRAYAELRDPETGRVRDELSQPRRCPVCAADKGRPVFWKNGFPHVVCESCGLLYVNRVLREEVTWRRLAGGALADSWVDVLLSDAQRRHDQEKFSVGIDLLERIVPRGRLLDIGCSVGHFLELALARGWSVEGVELNARAVAHSRSLGLSVRETGLTPDAYAPEDFAAVTLWEVLDDLPDPDPLMATVTRLLQPGGALLVLVPNAGSLAVRVMREHSATFDGATSVTFFDSQTLPRYLAKFGFQIREMRTIIAELGTLNNYLHYDHPYLGEPTDVILDMITPPALHDRFLGYKLLAVAQRA